MAYVKNNSFRCVYQVKNNTNFPGSSTITRRNMLIERTRTGNVNPYWKQQIANHQNATTAMSGVFETVSSTPIHSYRKIVNVNVPGGFEIDEIIGDLAASRLLPTSDTHSNPTISAASAQSQASSKALKQIHKAQVSMSGGVFLGEMREALHMLRHPAKALREHLGQYLNKLAKAKKVKPKKWIDTLSQTWLESSFGWRPFINDLEDAMNAYDEITKKNAEQYSKIRAVGKSRQFNGDGRSDFSQIFDFEHYTYARSFDEAFVTIRGEVKRQVIATAMDKARVFGLSPSEFLPTAWELLPWSFLADYFTNIGDILENAITDTSGVVWTEQATIKQTVQECFVTANVPREYLKGAIACFSNQGFCRYVRKTVSRSPSASLTVPPLTFELPGGPIKELNMVSLFAQANSVHTQDTGKLRGRSFR